MKVLKISDVFPIFKNTSIKQTNNYQKINFKNENDRFERIDKSLSFEGYDKNLPIKEPKTSEEIEKALDEATEEIRNWAIQSGYPHSGMFNGYAETILKKHGLKYYDMISDRLQFHGMLEEQKRDGMIDTDILPRIVRRIEFDDYPDYPISIVKYPGYTRDDYEFYLDTECTGFFGYEFLGPPYGVPKDKIKEETEKIYKKIEKTYKEVERLAKAGFIDRSLDSGNLQNAWVINREGNIVSARKVHFAKLSPQENNPKYIQEYLTEWKTAMQKIIKGKEISPIDNNYFFIDEETEEDNNTIHCDDKFANEIEKIIKEDKNIFYGNTGIRLAKVYMKDKNIYDKYSITFKNYPYDRRSIYYTMLNNKDFTIFDNLVKKFSIKIPVYDDENIHFYILKKSANYKDDESDLIDFGKKKVPLESIEKAYKDMEKLAKLGYIDELFLNWKVTSDNVLRNSGNTFRKLGYTEGLIKEIEYLKNDIINRKKDSDYCNSYIYELDKEKLENLISEKKKREKELKPDFVEKYLKEWKEKMIKINETGINKEYTKIPNDFLRRYYKQEND